MKNMIYIVVTMLMVAATSCQEDKVKPVVDLSGEGSTKPVLSNAASGSAELSEEMASEVFETFEWSEAEYGAAVAVSYVLKMDVTDDFSTAIDLVNTEELSVITTVSQINDGLIAIGADTGAEIPAYFRIIAQINGVDSSVLESEVIVRNMTPYEVIIDYPAIYVPGAYQGWTPGAEIGRLYSYDFNTVYSNILRIVDSGAGDAEANTEFKVTDAPNWDNGNWGGTLSTEGSGYVGTLSPDDGNMSIIPGTYEVTVDTDALSIVLTKTDDWGIIGDATPGGWDADTDLTYNGLLQVWEITDDFVAGGFKFRANDGWDVNLGGGELTGDLESNDDGNILISEDGNYTIQLDVTNASYFVVKN